MRDVKRYFYNALLLSVSALLMRSVSVAFNVYVTDKVGAEGMGILSLVGSAYGFAVTFATSGISLAVTRLCAETVMANGIKNAEAKLRRVMFTSVFYSILFGGIAGIVLFFGADYIGTTLLGDERCISSLRILAVTLAPTAVTSALSGYFNAARRVYKNAVTQVLTQAVKIGVTVYAFSLFLPRGVEYALIAVTLGSTAAELGSFLVTFILYIIDHKRYFKRHGAIVSGGNDEKRTELSADTTRDATRSLFFAATPVMLSACVRSGLVTVEHILIPRGLQKSGASSGDALSSYGTLSGMVMPIIMFPYAVLGSFTSLLVPELSFCRANGQKERIRHIGRLVFRTTLLFAIGTSGILILFARELGLLLYGSEEAGTFIRILAPVIPIMYLDTATDSMLKGLGEQLFCMRVNIADAAISCILVYIFVPIWGIKGYAAVIIIAEIINASLSILKLLSVADFSPEIFRWLLRPLFALVASCTSIRVITDGIRRFYHLSENGVGLVLLIIATAALYFAILAITNTVTPEDVRYVRGIFKNEKKKRRTF